jgi:hypothetical protein
MCKAICGVAAGAVGGVFNLHWAQGSDIADIQAKFGAQHTVTGSLGLLFAYKFVQSVSSVDPTRLWSLYATLTVLHLYANMQCMKIIAFDYLNTTRMKILVKQFLEQWNGNNGGGGRGDHHKKRATAAESSSSLSLMPPNVLARKEPLFFIPGAARRGPTSCKILFGDSFEKHRSSSSNNNNGDEEEQKDQYLGSLSESLQDQKYLISHKNKRVVVVSLAADATPRDKSKAYLHAVLLGRALQDFAEPELVTTVQLKNAWPAFEKACQQVGWDLDKTELSTRGYELSLVV